MCNKINDHNDSMSPSTGSQYINLTWASDPKNPHNWSTVCYIKAKLIPDKLSYTNCNTDEKVIYIFNDHDSRSEQQYGKLVN